MSYADPGETKHVLARWELQGDSLYTNFKKVLLEIPGGMLSYPWRDGCFTKTQPVPQTGNDTAHPTQARINPFLEIQKEKTSGRNAITALLVLREIKHWGSLKLI